MYEPNQADVDEIKALLCIAGTKHDAYILAMLPILFEEVKGYCNNAFGETVTTTPNIPGPVKLFMAKAIEFNQKDTGLKGRSMGTTSYSFETDLPKGLYKMLVPYRKVKFRALR